MRKRGDFEILRLSSRIAGTHQEAGVSGFSPVIDGRSVMLEMRYSIR
ncbi:MAG TPA: hypothetical protein VLV78_18330 [Thermoanaerobaculia bacterium]|nr:hypothetical protein [Thermoanaerobaculia bacterium]